MQLGPKHKDLRQHPKNPRTLTGRGLVGSSLVQSGLGSSIQPPPFCLSSSSQRQVRPPFRPRRPRHCAGEPPGEDPNPGAGIGVLRTVAKPIKRELCRAILCRLCTASVPHLYPEASSRLTTSSGHPAAKASGRNLRRPGRPCSRECRLGLSGRRGQSGAPACRRTGTSPDRLRVRRSAKAGADSRLPPAQSRRIHESRTWGAQ